jgi:gamma-glutamylcyclotransferase (GGCT)/AIG2-like uncharacterized protein YtfP
MIYGYPNINKHDLKNAQFKEKFRIYVFVYGSLMKDMRLHKHYMPDIPFVGKATIESHDLYTFAHDPHINDHPPAYPFLVFDQLDCIRNNKRQIEGEVYDFTEHIDRYNSLCEMEINAGYNLQTSYVGKDLNFGYYRIHCKEVKNLIENNKIQEYTRISFFQYSFKKINQLQKLDGRVKNWRKYLERIKNYHK